jgi:transcription elongation factor GreA
MDLITNDEKTKIAERLRFLQENRGKISERIAEARALGDLKENAEYHAAREQQGLEEAEIRRLEERLQKAQVVDEETAKSAEVVFLGSKVRLRNVQTGTDSVYHLVGESSGEVSDDYFEVTASSPMGESMMKARVGEQFRVKAPRGVKIFEVVELL